MGSINLLTPITTKLGNKSPCDEQQYKALRYNNNKQRSLIIRFLLFTLLAITVLLFADIVVQQSKCNPLSSQLPQQAVNKVIEAANSAVTIGVLRQKRIQRENFQHQEKQQQQQQQQSLSSLQIKQDNMKFDLNIQTTAQPLKTKQKRTLANVEASNTSGQVNQHQVTIKRFKTSSNLDTIASSTTSQISTNNTLESTMQPATTNQNSTFNENSDINNNDDFHNRSLDSSDVNNNTLSGTDDVNNQLYQQQWQRNINSVNGTIDLSQYGQNDVDRLYGDALLVYLKNFNE